MALVEQAGAGEAPRVTAAVGARIERSHATGLLESADWLLARAGWTRSSLDGFVATRGPGSFTGIRVGLGTVRGLALAADRPCVGVGSLEAIAQAHGPDERDRVALIGAGRGELYGARFDAVATPPRALDEPWLRPVAGLLEGIEGEAVLIFAPGSTELRPESTDAPARLRIAPVPHDVAAAAGVLALLRGLPGRGEPATLAPVYVRPPDAVLKTRRR
jgi:tRNA threonylcarbamoyladenosine biosynthesis protein TsaB